MNRTRIIRTLCCTLLAGTFAAPTATANDAVFGGWGSDLVPLKPTEVQMVSEDILIRHVPADSNTPYDWKQGSWDVTADYVFRNRASKPTTLQVGFPEYACEGGKEETMCDDEPLSFNQMKTTVNGEPVRHRLGKVTKKHAWAPRLGKVWLYDVTFAPGQDTRVRHTYRVTENINSGNTSEGYYVTRTGATWAGEIEHARFRIHVPKDVWEVEVEPDDTGLKKTLHLIEQNGTTIGELLLEAHGWEPTHDLTFYFSPWQGPNIGQVPVEDTSPGEEPAPPGCPRLMRAWAWAQWIAKGDKSTPGREVRPEDADQFLSEGIGDARICRNYIFAMYGRKFKDEKLNRLFYGPKGWVAGSWPYAPFEPNPNYGQHLLSKTDWQMLKLIDLIEQRRGQIPEATPKHSEQAATDPAAVPPVPAHTTPHPTDEEAAANTAKRGACGACSIGQRHASAPFGFVVAVAELAIARRRRYRFSTSQPARRFKVEGSHGM